MEQATSELWIKMQYSKIFVKVKDLFLESLSSCPCVDTKGATKKPHMLTEMITKIYLETSTLYIISYSAIPKCVMTNVTAMES